MAESNEGHNEFTYGGPSEFASWGPTDFASWGPTDFALWRPLVDLGKYKQVAEHRKIRWAPRCSNIGFDPIRETSVMIPKFDGDIRIIFGAK